MDGIGSINWFQWPKAYEILPQNYKFSIKFPNMIFSQVTSDISGKTNTSLSIYGIDYNNEGINSGKMVRFYASLAQYRFDVVLSKEEQIFFYAIAIGY